MGSDLFPWHEALCTAAFTDDLSWSESLRAWKALDTLHDEAVTQLLHHSGLSLDQLLHLAPDSAWQQRVVRACAQTVDNKLECTFTSQSAQHWRVLASLSELQSVVLAKGCRVFSEDHLLGRSLMRLAALRKLALPGVAIDDLAGVGIVRLLPELTQLESLDLKEAQVEEAAVAALGQGIAALCKLTYLDLCQSSLVHSAPAMALLAPYLAPLSALRQLHLQVLTDSFLAELASRHVRLAITSHAFVPRRAASAGPTPGKGWHGCARTSARWPPPPRHRGSVCPWPRARR